MGAAEARVAQRERDTENRWWRPTLASHRARWAAQNTDPTATPAPRTVLVGAETDTPEAREQRRRTLVRAAYGTTRPAPPGRPR